jgi:hypothetical protein
MDPETLRDRFRPVGATEEILVYKMFVHLWCRDDASRRLTEKMDEANLGVDNHREVALMLRYRTESERGFERAVKELHEVRRFKA